MEKNKYFSGLLWFFCFLFNFFCWIHPVYSQVLDLNQLRLKQVPPGFPNAITQKYLRIRGNLVKKRDEWIMEDKNFNNESQDERTPKQRQDIVDSFAKLSGEIAEFNNALDRLTNADVIAAIPVTVNIKGIVGAVTILTADGHVLTGQDTLTVPWSALRRMQTGSDGKALITLSDGTDITVSENTMLDFRKVDPEREKTTLDLMEGGIRWAHKVYVISKVNMGYGTKEEKKEVFELELPRYDCVAAVRGTEFEAFVGNDGTGHLNLISGKLEIALEKSKKKFFMKGGQKLIFNSDGTINGPMPLSEPGV
jgi:hypothetical protein